MTKEEYQYTQDRILSICRDIRHLELETFIKLLDSAEASAPVVDPTLYRAAVGNLKVIREQAQALLKVKKDLPSIGRIVEGLIQAKAYKNREQ